MPRRNSSLSIRKCLSGFTLIEVAVVLIIIGTIASILLPTLTSTVKRGKMSEARAVLYAVRDEIIGYAEAHNNTLPEGLDKLGNPEDPWGRSLRYFGDDEAEENDICVDFDSTSLTYTTREGETVSNVAFVLASDGPDHTKDVSLENATDGSVPDDDLLLYATLYHLQAILCDPGGDDSLEDEGTTISLKEFVEAFSSIANADKDSDGNYEDGVVVDTDNVTISLGNLSGATDSTYGCVWYNGTTSDDICADGNCTFGSGFRAHFVFTVSTVGLSRYLADGFTFSVISANSNVADSCGGTASTLGYSSRTGLTSYSDKGEDPFVNPPKIGVEFDFYYSENFNDPWLSSDKNADHLAILYWGNDGTSMLPDDWGWWKTDENYDEYRGGDDNKHPDDDLNSTTTPDDPLELSSGNPSPPDYVLIDNLNEDGSVSYDVRVEINRASNTNGTGNYTTQVWFDCTDCSDLSSSSVKGDFEAEVYSNDTMTLNATWHSMFDNIMFGWTEGTGTNHQIVTITNATFFFP